jgi:hypothetical protein
MITHKYRCMFAAISLVALGLAGPTKTAEAQSQGDTSQSVAEAARRAREQKKSAAKPVKTLTNDDLPVATVAAANVAEASGQPNEAKADAAAPLATAAGTANEKLKAPEDGEKAKQKRAEDRAALERAKKELATALGELDVMQRRAALDSDSYYSQTGFASDKSGKANLDAAAQQIAGKKQAVEELQAKVAELQTAIGEPPAAESDKNTPPN